MKKSKFVKKVNIISILIAVSLFLLSIFAAGLTYFMFVQKVPDPDSIPLPPSNKKILDKLGRF